MKKRSFTGGIHPLRWMHEGKTATRDLSVREFVSDSVCIPLDMHLGQASEPCVKKGDKVRIGQVIAEAVGPRGIPVHASVSGEVTDIGMIQQLGSRASLCITIQNDFADEWAPLSGLGDVEKAPADQIIPAVRAAGICGMGGACFPTHVKLSPPEEKPIDTILLNGAECETFLTSDHRLMLESPERVVNGLRAAMRALRVEKGVIAIEDNKMDAVSSMEKAAQGRQGVSVAVLRTKYPQGGEKQLIQAVTGRETPSGGLPMDAAVIVLNVGTAAAIADAVIEGRPLISRLTTVTGAVQKPSNLRLRIGTRFSDAIVACGGYKGEPGRIFAGGSMTGISTPSDAVSVTKATNGIVVLSEKQARNAAQQQCIRCGRCVFACPARIMPYRLMSLVEMGQLDQARKEHIQDCIHCGSCSYICPAKRWLAASIRTGKDQLARRGTT